MRIFIRIVVFSFIILLALYFYKPGLFDNFFKNSNQTNLENINPYTYTLTPNPKEFYIVNLKISSSNDYNFSNYAQATKLYFEAIDVFSKNIIQLLDNSENRKMTLKTHILELKNTQTKLENMISSLQDIVIQEETDYQNYYNQKQIGDEQFKNGFVQKSVDITMAGLNISYENAPKYTKHRVLANAGKIILLKLMYIKSLIDTKLLLLTNNSKLIVGNFDLIKGDLLRKLLELKYRLENNKYN